MLTVPRTGSHLQTHLFSGTAEATHFGRKFAGHDNGVIRRILFGLLCSAAAYGSSIPTFFVRLVSFDGPFVNGIPTYPYTLVTSRSHDGAPGDTWTAYINNLGRPNLACMRFGNQGLVPYEEAGWILLQTQSNPSSQWPDMN